MSGPGSIIPCMTAMPCAPCPRSSFRAVSSFWGNMRRPGSGFDYAIDYLNVVYTPWGRGGWRLGGGRGALDQRRWLLCGTEATNTLKSFTGMDLYQRPFFKDWGFSPVLQSGGHLPGQLLRPSQLGDYPGHKVAFNIRSVAVATGNGDYGIMSR